MIIFLIHDNSFSPYSFSSGRRIECQNYYFFSIIKKQFKPKFGFLLLDQSGIMKYGVEGILRVVEIARVIQARCKNPPFISSSLCVFEQAVSQSADTKQGDVGVVTRRKRQWCAMRMRGCVIYIHTHTHKSEKQKREN